jgi:hypothetical protein
VPRAKPPLPPDVPEAPERQLTATERLAALDALRRQHGGLPLPMPDAMHGAGHLLPHEGGDGMHVPNPAMREAVRYFEALSEIGTPGDMELAWSLWRTAHGIANPKGAFESRFDALKDVAGKRHAALLGQAEAEALPFRVHQEAKRHLRDARERLEAERRQHLAPLEAEVARAEAALAAAEKALPR